ncbi:B-cell receptor CD22-like [Gigantopelta aegis]|uniref:B-cell receptor CD22-like n=1 Tax=Gigantopelta aegis TaxID=1735272 RepID=UPI001B888869|nr:B-cell receptor CD22-like [Gigantopelta aegis]
MSLVKHNPPSTELLTLSDSGTSEKMPGVWESYISYSFMPNRTMNTPKPFSEFVCTATYLNETTTMPNWLKVEVPPTGFNMTVSPVAVAGVKTFAMCEIVEGYGIITLTWFLDSVEMNSTTNTTVNADLTEHKVNTLEWTPTEYDHGKNLTCQLFYSPSYRRRISSMLSVEFRPIVTTPSLKYSVNESTTVCLRCNVKSYPASTITWTKDNKPLSVESGRYHLGRASEPTLTISNVMVTDRGKYICSATNIRGTTKSKEIVLDVKFKPRVTIPPVLVAGRKMSATCEVLHGYGSFSLTWYFESVRMNSSTTTSVNADLTKHVVNTLELKLAREDNKKIVTCKLIHTDKYKRMISRTLIVEYSPIVTAPSLNYTVEEGSSVSLECNVRSEPPSTIVEPCRGAVNNHSFPLFTKLLLQILPLIAITDSPIVTAPSLNYTVEEGSSVSLECNVRSEPPSTTVWTKDDVPIDRDTTKMVSGPTSRTISNVTEMDKGKYICSATNDHGTTKSEDIILDVKYFPKPDSIVHELVFLVGDTVSLTCSVKANPAVTKFVWKHGGKTLPETGGILPIDTSKPKQAFGNYTCEATNPVGTSKPIVFTVSEMTEGSLKIIHSIQDFKLMTAVLVLVGCFAFIGIGAVTWKIRQKHKRRQEISKQTEENEPALPQGENERNAPELADNANSESANESHPGIELKEISFTV